MSHLLVNGRDAYEGTLRIPRVGPWDADVRVPRDGDDALSGPVTLQIGDLTWKGTVWRSGEDRGALSVRVVGGGGGLSAMLDPRAYQNVPARIPITDILAEIGETLSGASDTSLLDRNLPKWNRTAQAAGAALANLFEAIGATWRVLPDGSIWVGKESWPASTLEDFTYISQAPAIGTVDLVATSPSVYPGQVFLDRHVSEVVHQLSSRSVRTRVLFEEGSAGADRAKEHLLAIVRSAFPTIDFLAGYWCKVVAQNADLSLELQPDDRRLAGLSKVPIRYGLPGTSARVPAGSRVLLEFAAGDPSRPFASAWESASPTELVLGAGSNQPAALATSLRTELDALWSAVLQHTHAYSWTGSGGSGFTGPSQSSTPPTVKQAQTIASSTVKVKV